ncbi:hypothetical protein PR048_022308, partial [Dryococelus australis]
MSPSYQTVCDTVIFSCQHNIDKLSHGPRGNKHTQMYLLEENEFVTEAVFHSVTISALKKALNRQFNRATQLIKLTKKIMAETVIKRMRLNRLTYSKGYYMEDSKAAKFDGRGRTLPLPFDVTLTVLLGRQHTAALLVHQVRTNVHLMYRSLNRVTTCLTPCFHEFPLGVGGRSLAKMPGVSATIVSQIPADLEVAHMLRCGSLKPLLGREEEGGRDVSRFFGDWRIIFRFLHPGVTDKGNYTMFDMVRPLVTINGPPIYPVEYRVPVPVPFEKPAP